MRGKYKNPLIHGLAAISRERLRSKIAKSVAWKRLDAPQSGCSAIIGVCSRLPDVLAANMRCLDMSRWPELKRVILTVDTTRDAYPAEIEPTLKAAYPDLNIQFFFYTPKQAEMAKRLELPFVYCWLSWCIALAAVETQYVLIHDYDALILGGTLEARYNAMVQSRAKAQGISWYRSNGVEESDHLATTFEAFFDLPWLRSFQPIDLFNKLRLIDGRSIDMDITLDMQHRSLNESQRTVMPMDLDHLVHPSQMVHQYTMFHHSPGAALPCFSIPMIPFFSYLGGDQTALERATGQMKAGSRERLDFLGDGTQFNFTQLETAQVDWALKQMVQAFLKLDHAPDPMVYRYGTELYRTIALPAGNHWHGDFTPAQRVWIEASSAESGR